MSLLSRKVELKYVKKAFLVKFGNLYIIPKVKEEEIDATFLIEKIKECLSGSPLVKKVETLNIPSSRELVVRRVIGPLESISLSPIKFEVSLPIEEQATSIFMSSLFGERVDMTTDFGVIYNASTYVIFREANLSKLFHPGAPDVRDVLVDTIGKEKIWETKVIPPNPLIQDIYFVYLRDDPNMEEFVGKMFIEGDRLYYYLSEKLLSFFERILGYLLDVASSTLDFYYAAVFQKLKLEEVVENLKMIHQSIQDVIAGFQKLSFWNIYGHYKHSKNLEKLVSQHYSALLNYSFNLEILRKYSEEAEDSLYNSFLFRHFTKQLMAELKHDEIDMDTLTKCVNYARELVQKSYTVKVTLLGGLISIIGSILGTLILRFLGL